MGLFGLALAGTAALLDRVLPALEVPVIDEKLAHFAKHGDEFDTLFFGSSRTYHQLIPQLFDQATAAAGQPTRSFNFGADGMFAPEDGYVAERLFALKPKHLKRVFIEVSFFRNDWVGMDPDSVRALHWHDAARMGQAWQETFTAYDEAVLSGAKKPGKRPFRWRDWKKDMVRRWNREYARWQSRPDTAVPFGNVVIHLRLTVRRWLNSGRGAQWMENLGWGRTREYDWSVLGERRDGVQLPASRKSVPEPPLEKFDRLFAEVSEKPVKLRPMSLAQQDNVRRIVELVRGAGAEPILFVSPDVLPCLRYLPSEPDLPLFDFTNVHQWPELFRRENRMDSSHLDREGSQEFTRAFARRFLEFEAAKRPR